MWLIGKYHASFIISVVAEIFKIRRVILPTVEYLRLQEIAPLEKKIFKHMRIHH